MRRKKQKTKRYRVKEKQKEEAQDKEKEKDKDKKRNVEDEVVHATTSTLSSSARLNKGSVSNEQVLPGEVCCSSIEEGEVAN